MNQKYLKIYFTFTLSKERQMFYDRHTARNTISGGLSDIRYLFHCLILQKRRL